MKTEELKAKIEDATVTNEDIALWANWKQQGEEGWKEWVTPCGKHGKELPDWLGNATLLLGMIPPSLSWHWALLEATTICSTNGWGLEKLNRALLLIIIVYKDVEKTGFTKT